MALRDTLVCDSENWCTYLTYFSRAAVPWQRSIVAKKTLIFSYWYYYQMFCKSFERALPFNEKNQLRSSTLIPESLEQFLHQNQFPFTVQITSVSNRRQKTAVQVWPDVVYHGKRVHFLSSTHTGRVVLDQSAELCVVEHLSSNRVSQCNCHDASTIVQPRSIQWFCFFLFQRW